MKSSNTSYSLLSQKDKEKIIRDLYLKQKKSFADIAEAYDTYPNKIRRDAVSFKIPIRDKALAQKNALETGKHKHPTKGKTRSDSEKASIGLGVMKSWEDLSEQELQDRKNKSKEMWAKLDEDTKQNIIKLANQAVRVSSKVGSKLEKFLLQRLLKDGHKVEFHKEQSLLTTKLQIDLFIPSINTAIEVDGPSHFLPVWGEDALAKNISYDNKKQGLILGKGLALIRIKQTKDYSKTRSELIYQQLKNIIDKILFKFPEPDSRTFLIEDNNG
jgi:very-short-patch-repair endonuclease